ncbi:MAG: phospholipase D family protein [Acetobacteraceae bacterium]|nr:phospholipase D family protein [Acetobacteraceae bacterium]
MRRDGDRLLGHLAAARSRVLLCAPFIKVGVLRSLLRVIPSQVEVEVVTRWLPPEVAVGVSDLEVFDLVAARRGATLKLLDRLHAKIYLSDGNALTGSANLTGPALGWLPNANLELLIGLDRADAALEACLWLVREARIATDTERDRVRDLANSLKVPRLDLASDVESATAPCLWLPKLRRRVGDGSVLMVAQAGGSAAPLPGVRPYPSGEGRLPRLG